MKPRHRISFEPPKQQVILLTVLHMRKIREYKQRQLFSLFLWFWIYNSFNFLKIHFPLFFLTLLWDKLQVLAMLTGDLYAYKLALIFLL